MLRENSFKSVIEHQRDVWREKYDRLSNKSISQRFEDIKDKMLENFIREELHESDTLETLFKRFVALGFDDISLATRICALTVEGTTKQYKRVVLSVDCDTTYYITANLIHALFSFLEEFYPDLLQGSFLLERV